MTFRVAWTRSAQRDLSKLPPRVIDAILTYVDERLVVNPMRLSKPLRGDFAGLRSARSGDYRVLIKIDEGQQTIFVRSVDHRAHAYRPR